MAEITARDKSKKRTEIIEGAEIVFMNMGYELASMDKIAEEAGVSKRTVYNHFGSKENLFEVLINELLSQRTSLETIKYDSEKTLEEQLRAFAEAEIYLIDSKRRLELSRFLTITFLKDLEFQRKSVAKHPPSHYILIDWLNEAKRDGRIKTDNTLMAAQVFYAMVVGAITWPALFTDGIDMQAVSPMLDEVIAVFLARYSV